jgi:hypothetical protein
MVNAYDLNAFTRARRTAARTRPSSGGGLDLPKRAALLGCCGASEKDGVQALPRLPVRTASAGAGHADGEAMEGREAG